MSNLYLTKKQVKDLLGLTEWEIRNNGHLYGLTPERTAGGHRRYLMADVLKALKEMDRKRADQIKQDLKLMHARHGMSFLGVEAGLFLASLNEK
jgi:hypothetical protein